MKKIIMYVYNDITTDARVQRAANALKDNYELILVSSNKGKLIEDKGYRNILVGGHFKNSILRVFESLWSTYKLIKKERPDIVYGHDFYASILLSLMLKKKYCKKIVYDAHELFVPEDGNVLNNHQKFFYFFEKKIVNKVDLLVCASKERGNIMARHYSLKNKPIVIRNNSQLVINTDKETTKLVKSLDDFFKKPGITIVYAGYISKARKIGELVDSIVKLGNGFKVLIIGDGSYFNDLKNKIDSIDSICVQYTGKIPYACLGAILSKCDIGYLYYPNDTLNNTFCASNKVFEYASIGLPMIANKNITIDEEFKESKIGISNDNFVDSILQISKNLDFYKRKCTEYSFNNPWYKEAMYLLDTINNI